MPVQRRLAAVVVADVVGYSRLMERDEAGTLERLNRIRAELIDPAIAQHGGRIVKTTGDGLLLEFPSATAALRCAVQVQRALRDRQTSPDDAIRYRIGINLGDIIVEGDDILGDGVNVAARLEPLAEAGGICIASAVRDQVREDLGVDFVDAGDQHVKNISKPIRVFRVRLDRNAGARTSRMPVGRVTARWRVAGAGIALASVVAAAGVTAWQRWQQHGDATRGAARPPLHSLLVLPFTASGDEALRALTGPLTSDVTRALADSMRDTRVTGPASLAAGGNAVSDPVRAARTAGVRYVIEGELRPSGSRIAVTLRLSDAVEGRQVESQRTLVDPAAFHDGDAGVRETTMLARVMVADSIGHALVEGSTAKPETAQDYIDLSFSQEQRDPLVRARETWRLADEAIRLDPQLARGWSQRASGALQRYTNDFTADREPLLAQADADSLHAVTLDPRDPVVWMTRGTTLTLRGLTDAALAANDRARELDPSRFYPLILRGWIYMSAGRPDDALEMAAAARRGLGNADGETEALACSAEVAKGAYAEAIAACERAAAANPDWIIYANLAAAYALTGQAERAAQARRTLLRLRPDFTIGRYDAKHFTVTQRAKELDRTHLIAGLRQAGVPE